MTRRKSHRLALLTPLTLVLGLVSTVQADPIQAIYNTTGSIGTTGISGTPDVSFQGVSNGSLTTGQPFSLGQFIVTSPPDGETTTYATPFQITFTVTSSSDDAALPNAMPVTIEGGLSTEYLGGVANLTALFGFTGDPVIGAPPQNAQTYRITEGGSTAYGLYPISSMVSLEPTSQNGGVFNLEAELDVYSAPEPTPLSLLFATGMFLAGKHYLRKTRARRSAP